MPGQPFVGLRARRPPLVMPDLKENGASHCPPFQNDRKYLSECNGSFSGGGVRCNEYSGLPCFCFLNALWSLSNVSATRCDATRCEAILHNFSENKHLESVFEILALAPFGSPFSVPLEVHSETHFRSRSGSRLELRK